MSLLRSFTTRSRHDADEPALGAAASAELDALDAVLAGDSIDDAELEAFIRDVRAAAPEMDLEATQRLTGRVAARFATPASKSKPARRRVVARRRLVAGGAVLACGLVATVGVLALTPGLGDNGLQSGPASRPMALEDVSPRTPYHESDSAAPATADRSVPTAAASGSGAASTASGTKAPEGSATPQSSRLLRDQAGSPSTLRSTSRDSASSALQPRSGFGAAPDSTSTTPVTGKRAVQRRVDLTVRVKHGKLQWASDQVSAITRDAGGYVANSDLTLGQRGAGSATYRLRVASSQLDRAVDRLGALGTVTRQNETSQDITSSLDSAKARLSDANAERQTLLKALAQAKTAGQIAALRARLNDNRTLRASLDAQVKQVQRRADLTTIALELRAPSSNDPTADDGSWSLSDAATDAWHALRSILGGLLVALAVALPFALIGATAWAVYVARRRRARERALDAEA